MQLKDWILCGAAEVLPPFWRETLPLGLAAIFALRLSQKISSHPEMFLKKHGRKHALTGLAYLLLITLEFVDIVKPICPTWFPIAFHIVLGIAGTTLTLLAAIEFQHKNVKNFASGTLDEHATVTYNEMIEHAFYQGLNLLQIIYLHLIQPEMPLVARLGLLSVVTLPWYFRDRFPVNRFSDNYNEIDVRSSFLIRLLYRIKKYQYVFYKHFLLHGLNITVALTGENLTRLRVFRLYWLLLNTSYVMEFFLQTLVKKRYLPQDQMLTLQKVLMAASSLPAVAVLHHVSILVAFISLALNFLHRKHDLSNTLVLAAALTWLCNLSHADAI